MFENITLITALTVMATSVMAISAAIQAVRNEFDLFGAVFLSVITAVGGGTVRDLLIGISPVFWLKDQIYIFTAIPVGVVTYFLARRLGAGSGQRWTLLALFDAVGLALFTLIGVRVAEAHDLSPLISVMLGCITGIGGGIMRDIICGETPLVMKKDIYATLSLAGGGLYLALGTYWDDNLSIIIAFFFIALCRAVLVIRPVNMG